MSQPTGRPQFSVRLLLLTVTAVAVVMALIGRNVETAMRQREAIKAIRAMGAGLAFLNRNACPYLVVFEQRDDRPPLRISNEQLKQLGHLRDLEFLKIIGVPITDAGLRVLHGMNTLRTITLEGTRVTASGVADLQNALPDCEIDWSQRWPDSEDSLPERNDP